MAIRHWRLYLARSNLSGGLVFMRRDQALTNVFAGSFVERAAKKAETTEVEDHHGPGRR